MLNTTDFLGCVRDNLRAKRFSKKRMDEIQAQIVDRMAGYAEEGYDASRQVQLAARDVLEHMSREAQERAKRNAKMLTVQASNIERIKNGADVDVSLFTMDGKPASKGVAVARAAVSLIEDDPRFSGMSYNGRKEVVRGRLYSLFGDALESVSKGAFGRQKGKAHLPNVIREVTGENTGDTVAKRVAEGWLRVQDVAVDMFNNAGGTMNRLERYLPQGQNAVRMVKGGEARWTRMHMDALDWEKTRWPDGTKVKPKERLDLLKTIYRTQTTDGASKIDTSKFRGQGRAVGNMIESHRFMHYKNADAWLRVHDEFGDGNPFEVMVRHIETMAHKIAAIETFGPNPEMTRLNLHSIVRKVASDLSAKDVADAEAVLHNKFDVMYTTVMRENPMDPHSTFGNMVTGVSNILTSAQLGSASLLAIPGDFMQSFMVRALNRQGVFRGVDTYIKALATDPKFMREISLQSGFVMDEAVMATYAQTRFTGVATVGPTLSRHISEATMRLSLLSGHTRSARWAMQAEFMGMMQRMRDTSYDDLPFVHVMKRYGIEAEHWDALRGSVEAWQPRKDVKFLRPIDVLETDLQNKEDLFRAFQYMIYEEARRMVPEATVEAAAWLRNTTRPDTLAGALLYSFAMYKNFPVSFMMIYGRLGMTSPNIKGRLGFYAGLGAGMTMVGAIGTQLREMSKGRDPLPMDTPSFLGKSFLSGGALSIWGDFLFTGINDYGRGPASVLAGPVAGFLGDTTELALGDVFQFADVMGGLSGDEFEAKTPAKAVEWARRYTPGSSVWWARLTLERQVFDRLQELADPRAYQKQRNRRRARQRDFGQDHWWAPGQRTPERLPQYGE